MELDNKVECEDCMGTGKVMKSTSTIHSLPENECLNAMNSDRDLYERTKREVKCETCNGEGYISKNIKTK